MPYANQADRNDQARRRKAAGSCVSCGNKRVNANHCATCRDAHNARRRAYTAANRRFPSPLS